MQPIVPLLGGHGVDGAIHQAGGPDIIEECRQIRARQGSCTVGEAVMTTGGRLPAQYVIHTVGPIWEEGKANERTLLSQAYQNSFALAEQHYLTGIAYPNISTGVYRFPKVEAAAIAIDTLIPLLKIRKQYRKLHWYVLIWRTLNCMKNY